MQIFLPIHVVGAGLALLAGAVALATAKGGRIHRRSGMVFVYAMAAMCGAALLIAAAKTQVTNIIAAYDDLHLRIQADWMWGSVYDQATFVLPKYAKRASREEQDAITRLVDRLRVLSGRL